MKRLVFASLFACAAATLPAAAELRSADDDVKLVGCLIGGEDDDDGYLLTNATGDPASLRSAGTVTPGSVGTTGAAAQIFYWLEKDDELKPHLGHRIEVDGEIGQDLKAGEIEIDRKDNWTDVKIKSEGRELKARVPHTSVVAGPSSDKSLDVLVRKVDVKGVKMLAAACS